MSWSDAPLDFSVADVDWLDRGPAVDALRRMLDSAGLMTPLTVGIYGGWGTGKTSVMRTLQRRLVESPDRLMLWFEAWVYARQEEALWRALLLCVVEALRGRAPSRRTRDARGEAYEKAPAAYKAAVASDNEAEKAQHELDDARTSLYRSLALKERGGVRINWWGALPLAADAALTALTAGLNKQVAEAIAGKDAEGGIATALAKWFKGKDTQEAVKLIERDSSERYVDQVGSLEQFQETFKRLLKRFGIGTEPGERRLFIFVDDLDRCLPEDAVAALEAIKLFLDCPAACSCWAWTGRWSNRASASATKKLKAAGFDARAYLDKVIQVPFNLPPLGEHQIRRYLQQLSTAVGHGAFQACQRPDPCRGTAQSAHVEAGAERTAAHLVSGWSRRRGLAAAGAGRRRSRAIATPRQTGVAAGVFRGLLAGGGAGNVHAQGCRKGGGRPEYFIAEGNGREPQGGTAA